MATTNFFSAREQKFALIVIALAFVAGVLGGLSYVLYKRGSPVAEPQKVEQLVQSEYPHASLDQIRNRLKDPESAEFRNVKKFSYLHYMDSLCGEVNARNGFGGYVGFVRFIAFSDNTVSMEDPELRQYAHPAFETLWTSNC